MNTTFLRVGYIANDYYPDGSSCPWGLDSRLAAELAAELSEGVELVALHQSNGTTDGLDAALQRMLDEDRVDAVVGADWSRVAVAAAGILAPRQVPLLSGGATSSLLDALPGVFRTIYSDSDAQPLLASAGGRLGSTVALIASEDDFGLGGLAVLHRSFAALGVTVLGNATFASIDPATGAPVGDGCVGRPDNVRIVARAVAAAHATGARLLAVSATGPSTQCVFAAAASLGIDPARDVRGWLATEVVHPPGALGWASAWGKQVAAGGRGYLTYIGAPFPQAAEYVAFRRAFAARHGGRMPDDWAAYAYDCVRLLSAAAAGAPNATVVASATPSQLPMPPPRGAALLAALRASDVSGVTGPISFPPNRSSPRNVRLVVQQLGWAGNGSVSGGDGDGDDGNGEDEVAYEEVGASYITASGEPGLRLYLDPFLPRLCNVSGGAGSDADGGAGSGAGGGVGGGAVVSEARDGGDRGVSTSRAKGPALAATAVVVLVVLGLLCVRRRRCRASCQRPSVALAFQEFLSEPARSDAQTGVETERESSAAGSTPHSGITRA